MAENATINQIIFYDYNTLSEQDKTLCVLTSGQMSPEIEDYTIIPDVSHNPNDRYLNIGARAVLTNGLVSSVSAKVWIHVNSTADVEHVAKIGETPYTDEYIVTDEDAVVFDCTISLKKNDICIDTFDVAKSWVRPYYKVTKDGTTTIDWTEIAQEDITKTTDQNIYTFSKSIDVSAGGRFVVTFKWVDSLGAERVANFRVIGQGQRLTVNGAGDHLLINAIDKIII